MKISTETPNLYTNQRTPTPGKAHTNSTSFSAALTAAKTETSTVKPADFTSMTRQEMFDWMNDQIRSGKMSLDESSPFLGMTMKISVATGQPVNMSTDFERFNFVEKARLGVEGARSRNDQDSAKNLQRAIEIMQRNQGQAINIAARA
ncbi:hypothetical protein [Azonexus sp.]|uniref:hypothetical protein n=1 Tax=Azonexus sp. TaxID=1872668 RepID=UPI0027B9DFF1|nr:hypothetical protein [Azonexus sp.]